MKRGDDSYVKHILGDKVFYRRPKKDDTMTLEKPIESYVQTKVEDGINSTWFEGRWAKLNPQPFVKHTLGERCFYRRGGDDDTITFKKPKEGYDNCKEEDGVNVEWFETRWDKLNEITASLHNNDNKKNWEKWDL